MCRCVRSNVGTRRVDRWNLAGRLDIQCLYHGFGATYPTYPAPEFAQIEPSYLPTMCLLCASELPTPKKNETLYRFRFARCGTAGT